MIFGFMVAQPDKLDRITHCPPEPTGKTVLLIDVSDKLSNSQKERLKTELSHLSDTSENRQDALLAKGELFVVYVLRPEPDIPQKLFAMCHPGELSDRSALDVMTEGQLFAKKRWQEFKTNIQTMIDESIDETTTAPTSPIHEAVQYIRASEFPPPDLVSSNDQFKFLIWSDLIQNSARENHFQKISEPKGFFRSNPIQMDGIDVELMFLVSEKYGSYQPDQLVYWWRTILRLAGATLKFDYIQ